jgi:hypothetical protein
MPAKSRLLLMALLLVVVVLLMMIVKAQYGDFRAASIASDWRNIVRLCKPSENQPTITDSCRRDMERALHAHSQVSSYVVGTDAVTIISEFYRVTAVFRIMVDVNQQASWQCQGFPRHAMAPVCP